MTAADERRSPDTVSPWFGGFVMFGSLYMLVGAYWALRQSDTHVHPLGLAQPITFLLNDLLWPLLIFININVAGLHLT